MVQRRPVSGCTLMPQVLPFTGSQNAMSDKRSHIDTLANSAPAERRIASVEKGAGSRMEKKVPLAREPSDLDPTRYGDWEKNGRCIDF